MRVELITITVMSLSACSPASGPAAQAIDEPPDDDGAPVTTAEPTAASSGEPTAAPTSTGAAEEPPVACTKIGCMDGLEISTNPLAPKAGTYSVTVAAGSQSATCEVIFPYPKCGTSATKCSGTLPMMALEAGCELPKDKQTFPKLRVGSAPAEVVVTVTRDKKKVTEQKLAPAIEEFRPNGPKCGPVCKLGKLEVPLQDSGAKAP
jgi:hypothetical protein